MSTFLVRKGFCTQCGLCCNRNNFIISDRYILNRHVEFDDEGWCVHIDEEKRRCTIYEDRPKICKQWPRAPSDMITFLRVCGYWFEWA